MRKPASMGLWDFMTQSFLLSCNLLPKEKHKFLTSLWPSDGTLFWGPGFQPFNRAAG